MLLERYGRHLLLDEFGMEGQRRLAAAKVLMVGAGGLGCPAALYLAAAGVGDIAVYDPDQVELSNLQRQILHSDKRIGINKAESAKQSLRVVNPHCNVAAHCRAFDETCADDVGGYDIVLDCCDNYAARHLMNRACVAHKKPLVFGAASGFAGQTAVFDSRNDKSPCYQCLFSEGDIAPPEPCALTGVFAPLVGVVGCLQAAAAIKLIAMPELSAPGVLLLIEARTMRIREINIPRDKQCAVCGGG